MKALEKLIEMYLSLFEIFLDKVPTKELIQAYIIEHFITGYDDAYTELKDFIADNMKSQLLMTNINAILDCIEYIIYSGGEGGNSVLGKDFKYDILKNEVYKFVYGDEK